MKKRFQSLPVDNDIYALLYRDALKQTTTRTNVMNAILRKHFNLQPIPEEKEKFNPIVNLRSKVAKEMNQEELEQFGKMILKEKI